ncbi:estradiol 17-beta-dehydrogenase 11-like isoform X1 [Daktulosphaira vitifoliae]|uniref:estradiol 17-beta-dehydrogenase 11-like isoform X1 n=2 Tax=Daktulosphaira vitifoliae TaxID=58002 RepID=UPI0021AA950A|nr:estradiol 17-beta-dehydrogenase 11-like isoform X1 [Daktulosphaira vitifoliae]
MPEENGQRDSKRYGNGGRKRTSKNRRLKNESPINSSQNMAQSQDKNEPQPLAPPSKISWSIKNPISLIFEVVLIYYMYWITLYFKMLRVFLPKSKKSVKNNVVLITGTGRGLGRELALEFAKLGAKVACVDIDSASNEETAHIINKEVHGAVVKTYTVNVGIRHEVTNLAVKVELDLGPVDILINNAAVIIGHTFLGAKDDTIENIININLLGHFWMIRTFLPSMIKRNSGHIVAISSTASLCGLAKLSAYSATKSGVNGMMDSLREELRNNPNNNVQTTLVEPDLMNTSADYMKYINTRLPVLSVTKVAKATVKGILTNEVEFSVPSTAYYTNTFRKILPVNISDSLKNIFYVRVLLPTHENQDNQSNMRIIHQTQAVK